MICANALAGQEINYTFRLVRTASSRCYLLAEGTAIQSAQIYSRYRIGDWHFVICLINSFIRKAGVDEEHLPKYVHVCIGPRSHARAHEESNYGPYVQ